jgi:hypothetical protein
MWEPDCGIDFVKTARLNSVTMSGRAGGRALLLALLAVVTLSSLTARAEVDVKRAKEHFAKAEQLYRVERFQDAYTEYQEAFLAKPDPNILFNMAQCQRLMGNRADAIRLYRRFLAERPNPPNLAAVQKHLRVLEGVEPPPTMTATTPPPMSVPLPGLAAPAPRAPIIDDRPMVPVGLSPAPMRKGMGPASTQAGTAPSPSPAPPPATFLASNLPPTGAGGQTPAVSKLTAPPPVAAPPLPPQSLAMSHQPGTDVVRTDLGPGSRNNEDDQPVYKKWWFWTAVGAVLVGAVVVGVVASHKSDPSCDGLVACR